MLIISAKERQAVKETLAISRAELYSIQGLVIAKVKGAVAV